LLAADPPLPLADGPCRVLMAIGFFGCFLGWSLGNMIGLFILPPWVVALVFGGFMAYTCTLRNSNGDLARCVGMKVVAFMGLLSEVDEVRVLDDWVRHR
jgi:hypothetical protein